MRVQLCHGLQCVPGSASGVGSFGVDIRSDGWGGFEVFPLSDDYADVPVLGVAVNTVNGGDATMDFIAPRLAKVLEMPATATETDLGAGLHLTIGDDIGEQAATAPEGPLGAAAADMTAPMRVDIEGDVVAMWHLSPWDFHAEDGMDFKIEAAGLEVNSSSSFYEFRVESDDYGWDRIGGATSDGTWITTDGKLHFTTTLVLINEKAG